MWLCSFLIATLCLGFPLTAFSQDPLVGVDDNTTIRNISFRFVDQQTFENDRLLRQIALRQPGILDRLQDLVPLMAGRVFRFQPLELQRDVRRLERFYQRQGFPNPNIDYPASQFDADDNSIHIIFTVQEGDFIIIQDVNFWAPDMASFAVEQFGPELREAWIAYRDETAFRVGERYTEPERSRIENDVLQWVRDQGFAFAEINSEAVIDTAALTADINFYLDTGPRARVAEIEIEGNESVPDHVVRRELPLRVGDWYSHSRMTRGQRDLFGLDMFRVVLADIPEQEPGPEVRIRYRVQEGNLRSLSANTGYGHRTGLSGEGRWTHRNFLGGGRTFTVRGLANTGLLSPPQDRLFEERHVQSSLTIRQPYVGHRNLSGSISPFIEFMSNPLLAVSDQPLGINAREFGITSSLLYEIYEFRTISLQHTFSRALQFTELVDADAPPDEPLMEVRDLYDRSTLRLQAQLGRVDSYVTPREGFFVRPRVEYGPRFLGSALEYIRLSNEMIGYVPITDDVRFSARAHAGRLWPLGETRQLLAGEIGDRTEQEREENRLRLISFFLGGGEDLRGWAVQMAGDKRVRQIITLPEVGEADTTFAYEPEGGRLKGTINLELRLPFPGLGTDWRTAAFFDAGHIGDEIDVGNFRYGTGVGIRYLAPVGFIRLDVAAKLNPDPMDLRNPADFFRHGTDAETVWWRRFRLHLSVGQAF